MKNNLILFHITFLLLIFSCQKQNHDINFINGYWEIVSVSKNNKNIKKYPFSNTIDYFELTNDLSGFINLESSHALLLRASSFL